MPKNSPKDHEGPKLRVLMLAPICVVCLYFSAWLVFGTGPLYLAYNTVSEISGLLLASALFVGVYFVWRLIGRGFFRRAALILVALLLLEGPVAQVFASSVPYSPFIMGQNTSALADSSGVISEPSGTIFSGFPGHRLCVFSAGNESSSASTGYRVFSYARADSASSANCYGIGFIELDTYASGLTASASAESSIWWSTSGINVPITLNGYALLSILLDLSINGWQAAATGLTGSSQVVLEYAMKLVRDDGYQMYSFRRDFQSGVGFGGEYEPAYNGLLVESGHSYSVVVMFNATAFSRATAPTNSANTMTCFGFPQRAMQCRKEGRILATVQLRRQAMGESVLTLSGTLRTIISQRLDRLNQASRYHL